MPFPFFVCPLQSFSGDWNMGIDLYFYHHFEKEIFLRFYEWKNPTLSFGRNSYHPDWIDREYCEKQGMDLVRRPTGGKTVLHDREITYSIVAPIEAFPGGIRESSKTIGLLLKKALDTFGIRTELNERKENDPQNNVCFRETGNYELKYEGKKLVGSAQKRGKNRFLQHGSILIDVNFETWRRVWKLNSDEDLKKKIATLREITPELPKNSSICSAFSRQLECYLGQSPQEFALRNHFDSIRDAMKRFEISVE